MTPDNKLPADAGNSNRSQADILGEILLKQGIIQPDELERGKAESLKRNLLLRDVLTGLGIILEDQINWAISRELDIPFVLITNEMVVSDVISAFPLNLLYETRTVPIPDAMGGVTLVMADPLDEIAFKRLSEHSGAPLLRAVGPTGRVTAILEELVRAKRGGRSYISETVTKDTSGVAAVYGMLVAARKKGANRVLLRPMGDGIETAFRLERGWYSYRLYPQDQALAIVSRTRIMLGLSAEFQEANESATLNTRINGERLLIEGDFLSEPAGPTIDLHLYPIVSSTNLTDLTALNDAERAAILGIFSSRRPTGLIIVNAPDQRQRYRMIYSILTKLSAAKYDVMSLEERKYLEITGLRRIEVRADTPMWEAAAFQQCDVLAVCDAPFWRWRDLAGSAGERLVILGVDLVNSWLAFRSMIDIVSSKAILADRMRAIWSGRRVDLTCGSCQGEGNLLKSNGGKEICPECDGYGRFRGMDLFEIAVTDEQFRNVLSSDSTWEFLRSELTRITVQPSIENKLSEGIQSGMIFNQDGSAF